jgi:23S rRNA (guanine745-N1)-methyltransferase
MARSGYVNLLQPQDRRSKQPGDTAEAVDARQRLHDSGISGPLLEGIAEFVAPTSTDVVLDAGCGDGFYLGNLAQRFGFDAHGVDISSPAIQAAARRFPPQRGHVAGSAGCRTEWIIANADRSIPYADASFSLVLSITARMNSPEFRRVLRPDGRLLVAVASPLDLIELRGAEVNGAEDAGRDRVPRTVENFAREFKLADQRRVTTTAELNEDAVRDVLLSIYRPMRSQPIRAMRVTFSLDLLLFRPG